MPPGRSAVLMLAWSSLVTVFTANLNVLQPLGNDEFLLVNAFLDENHFVVVHESTAYLDSLVNVSELSGAVASHDDGVRVVVW